MFKDYDKSIDVNDDIPINSPEYLKRFQRSFNPMYIDKNKPVILSSMPKSLLTTSAFASGNYLGSGIYLSSGFSMLSGSGFGSGSAAFCGLGYGITLI